MSRTVPELLAEALLHLRKAKEYGKRELGDEVVIDAIALRLAAMIDALNRLPEETLMECSGDTWQLMRGMRNRIVDGYMTVDAAVIRLTVEEELPSIEESIRVFVSGGASEV